MITGSAFLPAPAYWQEGGASSRLAREASYPCLPTDRPAGLTAGHLCYPMSRDETECRGLTASLELPVQFFPRKQEEDRSAVRTGAGQAKEAQIPNQLLQFLLVQ